MSQTRLMSFVEATAGTVVGYLVALASQLAIFPMFGIHISLSNNIAIGAWFTVISLLRSYVIRRFYERLARRRARS